MYNCSIFKANYFLIFITLIIYENVQGVRRELKYNVNPACEIPQCFSPGVNQSFLNLVHVEAVGPNDTIHYLWSTINLPSLIVVQTSHAAALEINWNDMLTLKHGALWFTETPIQSIGLVLTRLWKYVDDKDNVDMDASSDVVNLNLNDFLWGPVKSEEHSTESITAHAQSSNDDHIFSAKGHFKIEFSAGATTQASDISPHLRFNGNSTQMRILFNKLVTGGKDRFAAELTAVSCSASHDKWKHDVSFSINDEYSPGVFKIHELLPPCKQCADKKSYLSWKPVAYMGEKATVANSSDATMSQFTEPKDIAPSIVSMFFNNSGEIAKTEYNMTFGTARDGFYKKTQYTSWLIMVGIGQPTLEELSSLAKFVMGVGLGTPCVITVFSGLFLIYLKLRKDDDELLLDE